MPIPLLLGFESSVLIGFSLVKGFEYCPRISNRHLFRNGTTRNEGQGMIAPFKYWYSAATGMITRGRFFALCHLYTYTVSFMPVEH